MPRASYWEKDARQLKMADSKFTSTDVALVKVSTKDLKGLRHSGGNNTPPPSRSLPPR